MKFQIITLLLVIMTTISCKTRGDLMDNGSNLQVEIKNATNYSMTNSEAGFYPLYNPAEGKVIILSYVEEGLGGTADGTYKEKIFMNLPLDWKNMSKETLKQAVEFTFEKQCFCRGEAGFYKVSNLDLSITEISKGVHVEASFRVPDTSHKISKVNQNISF